MTAYTIHVDFNALVDVDLVSLSTFGAQKSIKSQSIPMKEGTKVVLVDEDIAIPGIITGPINDPYLGPETWVAKFDPEDPGLAPEKWRV